VNVETIRPSKNFCLAFYHLPKNKKQLSYADIILGLVSMPSVSLHAKLLSQ
jgi:hypothetical protein